MNEPAADIKWTVYYRTRYHKPGTKTVKAPTANAAQVGFQIKYSAKGWWVERVVRADAKGISRWANEA